MRKQIFANTVSTADEGNSSNHTYQKEGKLLLLIIELSCMLLIRSCYFVIYQMANNDEMRDQTTSLKLYLRLISALFPSHFSY